MNRTISLPKLFRTPTISTRSGRLLGLALVALAAGFWVTVAALAMPALAALVLAWALGVGLLLATPFAVVLLVARTTSAYEGVRLGTERNRDGSVTR